MANQSPITGIIAEQLVVIDFGRHEGKTVSQIAKEDPLFYQRLVDQKENFAIRRHKDKSFRLYVNPLFTIES